MVAPVEPYWLRIRRLRAERELTEDDLVRRAPEGLSRSTIQALQRTYEPQRDGRASRSRYPSADTFERVAAALDVDPDVFPEYLLARAREKLDERAAGLDEAVAHLDRINAALRTAVAQRVAKTAEQQEERHRKPRAIRDEDQTPGAGA